MTYEERAQEAERRGTRIISMAAHRTAHPEVMRRAAAKSMATQAVRRLAESTLGKRTLTIDDYREMIREECMRPLEMVAARKARMGKIGAPRELPEDSLVETHEIGRGFHVRDFDDM